MDFKQIEAFISVAKLKSFSKAANTIFLSQPTISSHISSLEKELNIQLFDRTSKEVNLTPAGESFLDYAIDIVNTRNHAIVALSDFNSNISGKLNVSASTTPCNSIVPVIMKKFNSLYPEVTFDINEQSSGKIIKDILNLECEIGIVGTSIRHDKIKSYKLLEDELVVISHPSLNLPKELEIKDLLKYKFIFREKNSATRKTFEDIISEEFDVSKLNILCEVNNLDTLVQFVKTGMGISIVSSKIYETSSSDRKLTYSKIKNLNLTRNIYLIMNSKRTLTPTARAFFNMCKEDFKL
ncbi:selenium metabolism-associated LysR family transcriptional regulator [Hathewaya histolytica]|uniref:LysR family transcriptional regulator n=1 Tax=Hathewaya histolytica TaxID=1498 RepID=A0A4U9RWW6_HATHI|nr:selenium metabolism-associated LysR family transcriptional regulator [Hathewaya histolytica]VTQ96216.1 LysR family transcriptional regulator [Hathewaya histolytica]